MQGNTCRIWTLGEFFLLGYRCQVAKEKIARLAIDENA
jgi:hypothetical protein